MRTRPDSRSWRRAGTYVSESEWGEYYGGVEAGVLDLRKSLLDLHDELEPAS